MLLTPFATVVLVTRIVLIVFQATHLYGHMVRTAGKLIADDQSRADKTNDMNKGVSLGMWVDGVLSMIFSVKTTGSSRRVVTLLRDASPTDETIWARSDCSVGGPEVSLKRSRRQPPMHPRAD